MLPPLKGSIDKYLTDLSRIQATMDAAQRQVSSGLRVSQASDDPGALNGILQLQADISSNQQTKANFNQVTSELDSADTALQSAIRLMDRAVTLATQASGSSKTQQERSAIAAEISSLQEQMVGISQTAVNGRYIFSGDKDTVPLYESDPAQPNGVRQLASASSTREFQDINGTFIAVARTATDIFDARNPDGTTAPGNVFASLGGLLTALQNNDDAGIQAAVSNLKSADDHVNLQLAFYGAAQNRVDEATNQAAKFLVNQQTELSSLRDTDLPAAALQLTQAQVQQQAALTSRAKISQLSLFDFLA